MNDQGGIRTSQRVSRSCVECGRRKIKCDKKIPCKPCIRRNIAHECQRPITRVRGQLTVAGASERISETDDISVDELLKERCALQAQIAELETALALSKPCAHSQVGQPGSVSEAHPNQDPLLEDIVPVFEQFDLGVIHDSESAAASEKDIANQLYEPSTDPIFLLLPSRETSYLLITYSLQTLGWLHCAVDASAFLREHESFWDNIQVGTNINRQQRPWIALYLALLAVGLIYLDPEDIPSTSDLPQVDVFDLEDEIGLAVHTSRIWYEVALKEVERCGCSGSASLNIVQALSVLSLCHANYGEKQREWIFTGFAQNMARCLEMHRLGNEMAHSPALHKRIEWSTPARRELGRRIWWTYVIRDWLGSWSRPPSISPASFCCQFSIDSKINDNVLLDPSPNPASPSPLQYQSAMCRLAYIFYIYIKVNTHHTASKFTKAMEEIQTVRTNLPLHLSAKFPANIDDEEWESENPWVPFQRYLITHALDFMHLSIARIVSMGKIGNDSVQYRKSAMESAHNILQNYMTPVPRVFKLVWIVSAATVAASIYISIDMLMNPHEYPVMRRQEHIALISDVAIELRKYSAVAIHAAKGSSFVQHLLHHLSQDPATSQHPHTVPEVLRQLSAQHVPASIFPNFNNTSPNTFTTTPQSTSTGVDPWDEIWTGRDTSTLHIGDDYLHEILGPSETWDDVMEFAAQ